jgi:hypothetical protein
MPERSGTRDGEPVIEAGIGWLEEFVLTWRFQSKENTTYVKYFQMETRFCLLFNDLANFN